MDLSRNESGEILFRSPKWTTSNTIEVEVHHDDYGWVPFGASPDDEVDYGRELYQLLSTKYAGQVVPCPQSERDADQIDAVLTRRSFLLKDSDWTQLPDVPIPTKDEWAEYRQALRDITEQDSYPWEVVWPVAPVSQS